MNDTTKKVFISSALIFSLLALTLTLFNLKQQSPQSTAQVEDHVLAKLRPLVNAQPKTSARTIDGKSGNTWLDIQKKVKDTVIQVYTHAIEYNWLEPYKTPDQGESAGTGFFINPKGDFITNYHVVAQGTSTEIQIPSFGLERFDVSIIGVAPERDIALLTLTKESREKIVKKIGKVPYLVLGDSDKILRSQEVLALGYPLGQTRLKSTLGIVSGRERMGGFIQITAPLNPGNSGGPALNTNGDVIGINSQGVLSAQNVGYIIPINEVKTTLKDLYHVKLLRKPTLGCIFTAATQEMVDYLGNPGSGGWYISKVMQGTLLDSVGIKDGDMLYEINGHRVDLYGDIDVPWSEDKASVLEFLNRLAIGDTINFTIYRKGQLKNFTFKFEHTYLPPVRMIYPEFEQDAIDYEVIGGLVVMPLSFNHINIFLSQSPSLSAIISRFPNLVQYKKPELQHSPALIITHILPASQAFKVRFLSEGELVEEINGIKVRTLAEFRKAVLKSKQTGYLTVRTDDNFYAVMSLDKILNEERQLTARYFYPQSKLIELLTNKPPIKTKK
jgi:serine protease Do